ncbi:MAG: SusC/RagA family TonB-linked outer membrane protein, partial [Bacteroidetes bacterium]|nr:SusC/RagA family TonB-linked outer membrane protein [Bacteroidota bacterium]
MRRFHFLFLTLFLSSNLWAQEYDIQGTVQDANTGEPLIGVNVILLDVEDGTKGTVTDFEGKFTLKGVPSGGELQFSYIGYQRQIVEVKDGAPLTVQMLEDAQSLDEVVVIGYGTQKKRDVTGAVSIIDNETIDELKPIKVEQALQGTTPGVNVTTQSGSPGAGLNIRIRGVSTNGQNAPLVIIDGYQGDLNTINPNDIESITVLKDAQAAVYGTIGANGVILVTTKTGKKNRPPQLSYNTYFGQQETSRKLDLLNATEYALLLNEAYAAGGQELPFPNATGLDFGTDWQEEVFNTAPMMSHDLTVSGGSDRVTYSFSGSHLEQNGIIGGNKSSFRRSTARLSLGVDLTDRLKFTTNAIYSYIDRDALNEGGLGSVLFNALNAPPTLATMDDSGGFSLIPNTPGLGIEVINPLAQIANTFNDFDQNKLNGMTSLDYEVIDGLTLTGRIGFNRSMSEGRTFNKIISYGGKVFDVQRSSVNQNAINDKYLLSAMLRRDASTKFGPENRVGYFPSFTAGWVLSDEGFFNPDGRWNFAKMRLSYGVLGNDQIVNNGYIGTLSGEATYVFDGTLVNGTAIGALPNPALQWEEAKKFNAGVDLGFFDYKLNFTADYFINTRDNLLISNIPVSGITGTSAPGAASPTVNAGSVRNQGLEFSVSYQKRFDNDLKINFSYNMTTLDNEVLEVNNGTGFIEGGAFGVGQLAPSRMEVGQPIGYFFGYLSDGIFQNASEIEAHPSQVALGAEAQPGDIRYVDLNGDGVIDPDDRTNIGNPIPDYTMGLNLNFKYRGFDALVYTFASIGQDMVRNYERALTDVNRLDYYLNRWTGEGTSNEVPRVTTAATSNLVFSDFYVEDASFVRLQNIQLGYTLPLAFMSANKNASLRIYASVNNLLTFSGYRGFDPAAS